MVRPLVRLPIAALLLASAATASAQQLDARFSCSARGDDGEAYQVADSGEIHLRGATIAGFRWESALYRGTHGSDCSIDDGDGLQAEQLGDEQKPSWRIALVDAKKARDARGYDSVYRLNCAIRVSRDGDTVTLKPSCPALCGSRRNFSELSVSLSTGACKYEE